MHECHNKGEEWRETVHIQLMSWPSSSRKNTSLISKPTSMQRPHLRNWREVSMSSFQCLVLCSCMECLWGLRESEREKKGGLHRLKSFGLWAIESVHVISFAPGQWGDVSKSKEKLGNICVGREGRSRPCTTKRNVLGKANMGRLHWSNVGSV